MKIRSLFVIFTVISIIVGLCGCIDISDDSKPGSFVKEFF